MYFETTVRSLIYKLPAWCCWILSWTQFGLSLSSCLWLVLCFEKHNYQTYELWQSLYVCVWNVWPSSTHRNFFDDENMGITYTKGARYSLRNPKTTRKRMSEKLFILVGSREYAAPGGWAHAIHIPHPEGDHTTRSINRHLNNKIERVALNNDLTI